MMRGFGQAAESSVRLASSFLPNSNNDPVSAVTGLMNAESQVKASAIVVKTAAELQESVLDIIA